MTREVTEKEIGFVNQLGKRLFPSTLMSCTSKKMFTYAFYFNIILAYDVIDYI